MKPTILIADDDPAQRRYLASILGAAGHRAAECADGAEALARLAPGAAVDTGTGRGIGTGNAAGDRPALLLLDLHMPEVDGMAVLARLREAGDPLPVIVLTADGSISRAVEAMRAGATDFLTKPVAPERLEVSIRNALALTRLTREVRRLARQADHRLGFDDLIAASPAMREAIDIARRAARSDIPVLIEGESGTGKEVFARAIHGESARAGRPFVAVNCGALPATLIESILFGHEKGAFTGATARRAGKFQDASGGTLFLDEIGDLPGEAQVKLLRAVQIGEVDPVGAAEPVSVDVRIVSATNRDLEAMVAAGTFREDLYYRLGVFPLHLPPLRARAADLPALATSFLQRFAAAEGARIEGFTETAMAAILAAPWPGNVRELENSIYRAVVLAEGPLIEASDLSGPRRGAGAQSERAMPTSPFHPSSPRPAEAPDPGQEPMAIKPAQSPLLGHDGHIRRLIDVEREMIALALRRYRGRMSEIARRLGIGRSTLYRKIDDYQLEKPRE